MNNSVGSSAGTNIAIIGTGGTISNAGVDDPLDYLTYLDRGVVLSVDDVLSRYPDAARAANLVTVPFGTFRSRNVGPREWLDLRNQVVATLADESVAGVVIAHGTGTLEETAYYLNLAVATRKPIVVVGAQRTPSSVSSDAYSNFVNAVRVAASGQAQGKGALVVMNDAIHSARDVTKMFNHRLETMTSPTLGPLGYIEPDGSVVFYRESLRLHTQASEFAGAEAWSDDMLAPRVDVVYSYGGADEVMIDVAVAAGAVGIVVAGFAPGVNTVAQDAAIERALAAGVTVVQSTRTAGAVLLRESTIEQGLVASGDLTVQHARILLQMCLVHGLGLEQTREAFARY